MFVFVFVTEQDDPVWAVVGQGKAQGLIGGAASVEADQTAQQSDRSPAGTVDRERFDHDVLNGWDGKTGLKFKSALRYSRGIAEDRCSTRKAMLLNYRAEINPKSWEELKINSEID